MSEEAMSDGGAVALKTFELANGVQDVDGSDALYAYDPVEQNRFLDSHVWKGDHNFFKNVKMSALALLKMLMHARSGGGLEVMGLMQGKVEDDTFIVMDVFALPVEGTETRVNVQEEAYPYMISYLELIKQVGRQENVIGWYHSHPGYGAWLSGIDVSTQRLNQQGQDPFLSVVIDPVRTCSTGKVELGAFRTYPDGYKPPDEGPSEYQSIPLEKIEDFGVHCKSYYELEVDYFKSSLDRRLLELLWNKYWMNTLSASPLLMNASHGTKSLMDLANKLEDADRRTAQQSRGAGLYAAGKKKEDSELAKASRDGGKATMDMVNGLAAQVIKDVVFNQAFK